MYSGILFLVTVLIIYCDGSSEAHYECGAHGRFEYCIDGIPGCVIGCHCHPGYYFDTESKICEPNMKLAQDYRRHYFVEPTRVPRMNYEPISMPTPTAVTMNAIEAKVDAIAKDSDDLGDWLYNQFFKTIENQVINKTDGDVMTRRSGAQPARPVPRRRSHKKSRKKSKKKRLGQRFRKKGLRRKLMKITEDDSLFDSTSDEDSSTSSSETDCDSSDDSDSHDHGHGHRKIIMMNKKKTSPLPSFVFLPNIDTPFYPPIGLPAPAVLPMYPMVPVPPVSIPIVTEHCNNESTTTTSAPTSTSEHTTTAGTTEEASSPADINEAPTEADAAEAAMRKNGQLNKIMRLRNKMKKRNRNKLNGQHMNSFQNPETPFFNDPVAQPPLQFRAQPDTDNRPPLEDVDFKYLSQLIHKMDFNKTKPAIQIPPKLDVPMPLRRTYEMNNHIVPTNTIVPQKPARPASKADEENESFYSNLGKQIAALIRKVDDKGEHEFNMEIERKNIKSPLQTVFTDNNTPHSYWERFVRSPFRRRTNYAKEFTDVKQSGEKLFNLENQVSVATAIERTLSLHELENIANIMKIAQSKPLEIRKPKPIEIPTLERTRSKNFDINLLPLLRSKSDTKSNVYEIKKKSFQKALEEKIFHSRQKKINPLKIQLTARSYEVHNKTMKSPVQESYNIPNILPGVKNISKHDFLETLLNSPVITPLHQQVSRIVHGNMTIPKGSRHAMKYQLKPVVVNYKGLNYVGNNQHQHRAQHSIIPFKVFSQHTFKTSGTNRKPSYFHHEFHHFDYFE